jgi:hypothetical protein
MEKLKDMIIGQTAEVVRERLIGHKKPVNSLDIYRPETTD